MESKNLNTVNSRLEIVKIAKDIGVSKTSVMFKKSRTTITEWIKRYDKFGKDGLKNRGKGKTKHKNRMPEDIITKIITLKKNDPNLSAYKIIDILGIKYSPRTVYKKINEYNSKSDIKNSIIKKRDDLRLVNNKRVTNTPFQTLFLSIKKNDFTKSENTNPANIELPNYRIIIEDKNTGLYFIGFSNEKSDLALGIFCDYFFSQLIKLDIPLNKITLYTNSFLSTSDDSFFNFIVKKKYNVKLSQNYRYKTVGGKQLYFEKNETKIGYKEFLSINYSHLILDNIKSLLKQDRKRMKSYKNIIHSLQPIIVDNFIKNISEITSISDVSFAYISKENNLLQNSVKHITSIDDVKSKKGANNYLIAEKIYEKLLLSLSFISDDKLKFHILRMFVNIKLFHGKIKDIKKYLDEMFLLAKKSDENHELILTYQLFGEYYFVLTNIKQSIKYFLLFYKEVKKTDDIKSIFQSITKIAICYIHQGNLKQSEKYYDIGLGKIDLLELDIIKSSFYFYYGDFLRIKKEFTKALKYTTLAQDLIEGKKFELREAQIAIAFGNIYGEFNEIERSIKYYEKSLELYQKNKIKRPVPLIYNNMANAYIKSNSFDKALTVSFKSLELIENSGDNFLKANTYINIATIYLAVDKLLKAESYLKDALVFSRKIKNSTLIKEIILQLAKLYYKQNRFIEGTKYCKLGLKGLKKENSIFYKFKLLEISIFLKENNDKKKIKTKFKYYEKVLLPKLSSHKYYEDICSFYILILEKRDFLNVETKYAIRKLNYYFKKIANSSTELNELVEKIKKG